MLFSIISKIDINQFNSLSNLNTAKGKLVMNKMHSVEKKVLSGNLVPSNNCTIETGIIDHVRHTAEIMYEEIDITNFGWDYWNRIPNTKEIFNTVATTSLIDVLTAPLFTSLGNHPSAKNVLRDIAKIPSIMMNAMQDTPIGGTKYMYDAFNVGAAVAKVGCKVTFIFGVPMVMPQAFLLPTDIMARIANGVCEVPSSALLLAGKERQDKNEQDIPAVSYFFYNLKAAWFLNGILNTIGKVSITDSIGTAANSLFSAKFNFEGVEYKLKGMSDVFKYWVFKLPGINHVFSLLFESDNLVTDLMAQASKKNVATFPGMYQVIKHEHAESFSDKVELYVSAFVQDYILKALSEVGITLILTAPARVVVDSISAIYKIWDNNEAHIELLRKKGIDICAIEQEHGRHHQQDSLSTEQLAGEQVKVNEDL